LFFVFSNRKKETAKKETVELNGNGRTAGAASEDVSIIIVLKMEVVAF
jgi:hypothetical protein